MYAGGDPQGEHQPGGHEDGSFNVAEEHANGQQRHAQEEAPLHPTNLGSQGSSRGTDFSLHRLLPPPLALCGEVNHNSGSVCVSSSSSTNNVRGTHHAMAAGTYPLEPLVPPRWVGYGPPTYQCSPVPNYSQDSVGLGGSNHMVYPPYPMPSAYTSVSSSQPLTYADPPSTPGHHHDATVTSPVAPSPQPTGTNNTMHLYHPANAGLYTLCQAAMMTSSHQESDNYTSYQPTPLNEQSQPLDHPQPRPPPPYLHYYPQNMPFSSNSLQPQTSPDSPAYSLPTLHQQSHDMPGAMCPKPEQNGGPSYITDSAPPSNDMLHDQPHTSFAMGQCDTEELVEREDAVFVNQTGGVAHDTDHPEQSSYSVMNQSLTQSDTSAVLEDSTEQPEHSSFMNHMQPMSAPTQQPTGSGYVLEQQVSDDSATHSEEGLVASLATAASVVAQHDDDGGQQTAEDDLATVMMLRDAVPSPLPLDRQQTHLSKNKRTRTAFSQAQQDKLELAYHANPYPDGFYRQKVAQDVGIPEDRIQVWFQNRRARGKKQARTGSISHRSRLREHRLRINLTLISRQAVLLSAASQGHGSAINPQSISQNHQFQELPVPGGSEVQTTLPSSPEHHHPNNHLQVSEPVTLQPESTGSVPDTTAAGDTLESTSILDSQTLPFSGASQANVTRSLPVYNHGSSTICYLPQTTAPNPDSNVERKLTPYNLTVPQNNPSSAMYIFPSSGPPRPHSPIPTSSFPHPSILPLQYTYPPNPSLPYPYPPTLVHPLSLPPFLPPCAASLGSAGSSPPSSSQTISPGMFNAGSTHSAGPSDGSPAEQSQPHSASPDRE